VHRFQKWQFFFVIYIKKEKTIPLIIGKLLLLHFSPFSGSIPMSTHPDKNVPADHLHQGRRHLCTVWNVQSFAVTLLHAITTRFVAMQLPTLNRLE